MSRISIIIPSFNKSEYLKDALHSVITQSLAPHEVIIVDDGSEKEHAEVIDGLSKRFPSTRVLRHPKNRGVSAARNTGIEDAKGEFLLFLDDDDMLDPGALAGLTKAFTRNSHAEVVISDGRLFNSLSNNGKFERTKWIFSYHQKKYAKLPVSDKRYFLEYCPMIHSMLFRRGLFGKFRFSEKLKYGEDRYLWMQMRHEGVIFHQSDLSSAVYRIGSGGRFGRADRLNFFRLLLKSGLLETSGEKAYVHTLLGLTSVNDKRIIRSGRHILQALFYQPAVFRTQVSKFLRSYINS